MIAGAEVVLATACVELVVDDVAALNEVAGACPYKIALMARDGAQPPKAGATVL